MVSKEELANIIRKHGFVVERVWETPERIVIDFRHPKMKVKEPIAYFLSSVAWDKKNNILETIVRTPVPTYKELYLDYCVEDGEMVCRPHFWAEEKIVSVQATFFKEPLDKFDRLLAEMFDPPERSMDDLWWIPMALLFLVGVLRHLHYKHIQG